MPGPDTLPNAVSLEFGESYPRIGVELGVGEEFLDISSNAITNSNGCRVCGSD